jgi:hypothetical protein
VILGVGQPELCEVLCRHVLETTPESLPGL